jgi:hypothetical protein
VPAHSNTISTRNSAGTQFRRNSGTLTTIPEFPKQPPNRTRSTGSQTEAGKTTVSQNRTTYALNYNAATFRVLSFENQADYDPLLKQLQTEHQPETPTGFPARHLHGPTPLAPRLRHQQRRFYANPANPLPPEAQKFMEETTPKAA